MCGVCGELRFDQTMPRMDRINAMLVKLQRRGPDHEGIYSDNNVALGHRRLSIIDLSTSANQPMVDAELGLVIVFNGTIYNYPELRDELQANGYHFFSHGDTEVILKAFHFWGEKCVEKLHGMFAFAIWNCNTRELFLARDRLGIKPLYFSCDAKRFCFASNTQSLLARGDIDTGIDTIALHHQLTLHAVIPAPRTILNGIRKLEPGTTIRLTQNGRQFVRRYWTLTAQRPDTDYSEAEWIEQIHNALRIAVKKRLSIADVPVGVLLSGGLDSSLLVALLAEQGVQDIKTFSIGFEDSSEERGSEFEFSDQIVERYQTDHHKIYIPNDQVLSRLPEAIENMAEPMVGQDAVAFYLLAEQVSKQVKVVQSGQGADEVFAGYFWYEKMQQTSGSDLERFRQHYFDRDHDEYLKTVTEAYAVSDVTSQIVETLLNQSGAETFMDKVLRMDVTTLIVDDPVKRVDNMTMAWGLEARVPFLDQYVVELAAKIPPKIKMKSSGKHPLKEISRELLPESVINRPKGYFPMPALKYVRGPFLDFMKDILNSDSCVQRGVYNREYVNVLLASPETHMTRLNGSKLWHLALLEYWMQLNVSTS